MILKHDPTLTREIKTVKRIVLDPFHQKLSHLLMTVNIRAGKDEMHKTIMADLKEAGEKLNAFLDEYPVKPENDDAYIDAAIQRWLG